MGNGPKALISAVAGVLAAAGVALAADSVKLTGCLVKGDGDGAGYLLVSTPMEPGAARDRRAPVEPGAVGTSGSVANVFYWLDDDDGLRQHVGHRVEIEGDQQGEIRDGEISIDRKTDWTEIDIESDGRSMKAQVPNASIVPGPNPDRTIDVLVRRVDVDKVRMLGASCR
jgi:hypothetical protein